MVRITTIDKRGRKALHEVPGSLANVRKALDRSHNGIVNFGHKWWATTIYVNDVVAIDPLVREPARIPSQADFLAADVARDRDKRRQAAVAEQRREACRGGSELVLATPNGTVVHLLARPFREVVWELVTADSEAPQVSDGLGGTVTVRVGQVSDVRPFE